MRHGAGRGLDACRDHLEISAQLYGIAARARAAADLAEVVGEDALTGDRRAYLRARDALEREFLTQPLEESRTLEETLDRAWAVASLLPAAELSMISPATLDEYGAAGGGRSERAVGG